MGMRDCSVCGAFCVFDEHVCPPIFYVWCPEQDETEDDAEKVHARTHGAAAEQWASRDDSKGDYSIVRGNEAVVLVRQAGEESFKVLVVSGESVPSYSSRDAVACPICTKFTPVPDEVRRIGDKREWVHYACARKEKQAEVSEGSTR